MRQRTSYPKPFKAQIVQECLNPDVSIASVALRHGINANLVRKWIHLYRDQQASVLPAFIPLKLEAAAIPVRQAVVRLRLPASAYRRRRQREAGLHTELLGTATVSPLTMS